MRKDDPLDADAAGVSAARSTDADLQEPMSSIEKREDAEGGFDAGIEGRCRRVLVSPRVPVPHRTRSRDGASRAENASYRDQRSRTGFAAFVFSVEQHSGRRAARAAARGDLDEPAVLEQQVTRMLADPRSQNLVTNFAAQWLHLRNLESITPDVRLFPDFDDNLRQAMRQETELFFESVVREDRSVLDLLGGLHVRQRAPRRALRHPERLRQRFRRVDVSAMPTTSERGGLLAAGEHPVVTSYADAHVAGHSRQVDSRKRPRHSAATAAADVPRSRTNTVARSLPVRERLAEHRAESRVRRLSSS